MSQVIYIPPSHYVSVLLFWDLNEQHSWHIHAILECGVLIWTLVISVAITWSGRASISLYLSCKFCSILYYLSISYLYLLPSTCLYPHPYNITLGQNWFSTQMCNIIARFNVAVKSHGCVILSSLLFLALDVYWQETCLPPLNNDNNMEWSLYMEAEPTHKSL